MPRLATTAFPPSPTNTYPKKPCPEGNGDWPANSFSGRGIQRQWLVSKDASDKMAQSFDPGAASPLPRMPLAPMSRPQVSIERLPARRMSTEPRESMNCKSCRKRKVCGSHRYCQPRFRARES
jgi:hypothetical protein